MTLIMGGSGSGKSAFAEAYIEHRYPNEPKYYIATMEAYDDEAWDKIRRHRSQRQGKQYITIEQPREIDQALRYMTVQPKYALLECISNLLANEMYQGDRVSDEQAVREKIVTGINHLRHELADFVVVTNNVFEDGEEYEESTMTYLRLLGCINADLARMADEVIEVVVGIPMVVKERQIH